MKNRNFTLYFSWSRLQETTAALGDLDNRYPTLFEVRRQVWPLLGSEWGRDQDQHVAGFLDFIVKPDFGRFTDLVHSATHRPVRIVEREGQPPAPQPLDTALLAGTDTLVVVSLDHLQTRQRPSGDEVAAVEAFLERENTCLIVAPHHDVGLEASERKAERIHHDDVLIPSQQRIGGFATALLVALRVPIEPRYGLNPLTCNDEPAPLLIDHSADRLKILAGVDTFNAHPHLPHLYVEPSVRGRVRTLARQHINLVRPHPFIRAGNRTFDAFHWIPPFDRRKGHIFVCDATLFSEAFRGIPALERLWTNLTQM